MKTFFARMSSADILQHLTNWENHARTDQISPQTAWAIWLLMGGRGSGKTRAGAEWVRARAASGNFEHIGLVAPNLNDGREVMLDGESGLLRIGYPSERPKYISSRRRLEWPNGAVGHIFSAEDPDSLRGPQFDTVWADEFCAWRHEDETLSNLRLALRLGDDPRLVITTTPRPTAAFKRLLQTPDLVISRAKTYDNAPHLAKSFLETMEQAYGGTRLGRQELDGDLIEDHPGALWTRSVIDAARVKAPPPLSRIIVSIDPPTTSGPKSDRCGLIVAGRAGAGREAKVYILQDASEQGLSPEGWARRAIELFHNWEADSLLAETNQGGDMIRTILNQIDPTIPLRTVHASRGKITRAEPVAALYEQGRVHHVGRLHALEDEMALMGSPDMCGSPDRVDALVWAVSNLLIEPRGAPRIRPLY